MAEKQVMTNTREKMNVRKLHFFFKFQISSLALGFLLQSPGVRLDVLTPIYTAISSGVGGVKMHFKSVSVYVNLSENSLSPKYGMHTAPVPSLPLGFICAVLSM